MQPRGTADLPLVQAQLQARRAREHGEADGRRRQPLRMAHRLALERLQHLDARREAADVDRLPRVAQPYRP